MLSKYVPQFAAKSRLLAAGSKSLITALACAFTLSSPSLAHSQVTMSGFEDVPNAQQDLFYRSPDQHIYFRYYNSAQGWQIQDVTTLSGAPLAAPATHVTSFKDDTRNEQHVVFEAANGHIYQAYSQSNPGAWSFQDVTAITASNGAEAATPLVSYYDRGIDVQYIFSLDLHQHVNVFFWHGGWSAVDATANGGAAVAGLASALTGFAEDASHVSHVFYEGNDQHVHELYTSANSSQIFMIDNTSDAGATPAAIGSPLASHFDNQAQQEHVYYLGTDQHLHHLQFTYPGGHWLWEDLTAQTGSVVPELGSSLSSFQDAARKQAHIFYVGADQHLHQMYSDGSWTDQDVTSAAGAPVPAELTPVATFKDDPDNQQHAFYLGANAHFYHLYYDTKWNLQDLTMGVPLPALKESVKVSVSAALR